MNVGDTVVLTAPDLMLEDGSLIYAGEKGMVVGHRGFTEVIVSWGTTPPYRTGACRPNDVRIQLRAHLGQTGR